MITSPNTPSFVENFKDIDDGTKDRYPVFQAEFKLIKKLREPENNKQPKSSTNEEKKSGTNEEQGADTNEEKKPGANEDKKPDAHEEQIEIIKPSTRHNLVGLALSGGGIRSATFNLGLLQALCCHKMIKRVHYLSTVSGGGFIGSCLTTLLNSKPVNDFLSIKNFPFSNRLPIDDKSDDEECKAGKEKEPVTHLRYFSNYITAAGTFIQKYVRPAMVFLRSVVLNFITIVPYIVVLAIILAFALSLRTNYGLNDGFSNRFLFDLKTFEDTLEKGEAARKNLTDFVLKNSSHLPVTDIEDRLEIILTLDDFKEEALGLQLKIESAEKQVSDEWRPVWLGPVIIFGFMIGLAMVGLPVYGQRFKWRFWFSGKLGTLLLVAVGLAVLYLYGVMLAFWGHWELPPQLGFLSLLSLLVPKLLQAIESSGDGGQKPWVKIVASIILLALVPMFLLFLIGVVIQFLIPAIGYGPVFLSAVLLWIISVPMIDINKISLHNFYRDRLSRAYLIQNAETEDSSAIPFQKVRHRDKLDLSKLGEILPYHLVNVNLNLSKRLPKTDNTGVFIEDRAFRDGESFILSKQWCGSEKTGYQKTVSYETRDHHLNLGTAMAISGAAANVGMGLINLPFLRLLLGLLNIRLGYWAPHPKRGKYSDAKPPEKKELMEFFRYYWDSIKGNIPKSLFAIKEWFGEYSLKASYINLSDGGHFDNLGVYELLRRRCKYIIVGDAEADAQMSFNALACIIRLARIDFGIIIDVDIADIKPDQTTGLSRNHCAVGLINYPAADGMQEEVGYLLYCKSSLTGDEPPHLHEYKVKHPTFPHQTTADQWFDERQFEVYRELGYHVGKEALTPGPRVTESGPLVEKFLQLKQFWYPHLAMVKTYFSKHGEELNKIITQIKNDDDLKFMDAQIYPQWRSLMKSSLPPPPELNLWLPDNPVYIRKGFYVCNLMIQLMENVYTDLDLENTGEHPDNAGWMNLFMHWSGAGIFRVTWAICACTYGGKFQKFCEKRLNLDIGDVEVEEVSQHFTTQTVAEGLQLTADSEKALDRYLNRVEIEKINKYLNAFKTPPNRCFAFRLTVKNLTNKSQKKEFWFGFALVGDDYKIHYLRVQNHLRKMGLGRKALEKLLDTWQGKGLIALKDVQIIDDEELKSKGDQKELIPRRKIFEGMFDSVKTKLEDEN